MIVDGEAWGGDLLDPDAFLEALERAVMAPVDCKYRHKGNQGTKIPVGLKVYFAFRWLLLTCLPLGFALTTA